MAVQSDDTSEVIYEAMRQVLAARAIHNIFRMTESHLMVTSKNLRYCKIFIAYPMSVFCSLHAICDSNFCFSKEGTLQGSKIPRVTLLCEMPS